MQITVNIPYGNREEYIDIMYDISNKIGREGSIILAVNNNPYSLEALIIIQIDNTETYNYINNLISNVHLQLRYDKGLHEIINDMQLRCWNTCSLPYEDKETFLIMYNNMFQILSKSELEKKGYYSEKYFRPMVFISYCHDNANIVNNVKDKLKENGVNVWIDTEDLQSGVCLIRELFDKINNADITLSFISKSMINSKYAQGELEQIMTRMINKESFFGLYRLDDVNPNNVFSGLNSYFYIDYYSHQSIDEIVNDVMKKINTLNKHY